MVRRTARDAPPRSPRNPRPPQESSVGSAVAPTASVEARKRALRRAIAQAERWLPWADAEWARALVTPVRGKSASLVPEGKRVRQGTLGSADSTRLSVG